MTHYIPLFYIAPFIIYTLAFLIAFSRFTTNKNKPHALHYTFLMLAFFFFLLSTTLNGLQTLLDYPLVQGVALNSGIIFLFCAITLFVYLNGKP